MLVADDTKDHSMLGYTPFICSGKCFCFSYPCFHIKGCPSVYHKYKDIFTKQLFGKCFFLFETNILIYVGAFVINIIVPSMYVIICINEIGDIVDFD